MRTRDEDTMRVLREQEHRIRASEFWRGKPKGAGQAVKRLYRTGTSDCGGSDWPAGALLAETSSRLEAEREKERQFEAMWLTNAELAKSIDW